jgi:hypothetical protein
MCERIAELRQAVCHYAGAFEPDLVSGTDALTVMQEASVIERAAATLKALAAARVNQTSQWRRRRDLRRAILTRRGAHNEVRRLLSEQTRVADARHHSAPSVVRPR